MCKYVCAELAAMDWSHMEDRDPKEIVKKLEEITELCTKAL
jgi:hypothetical protein